MMRSELTLQVFQAASDRFTAAEQAVLPNWQSPCGCQSPGHELKCQHCPYFKGYVLRLQQAGGVVNEQMLAVSNADCKLSYADEVMQQCVELYQRKFTIREIVLLTGVTNRRKLWKRLTAAGLVPKPSTYPPGVKQQCVNLYCQKLSPQEIEDQMQIPADVINNWIRDTEVQRSQRQYSEQQKRESLALYQQGKSIKEIEAITGVFHKTVQALAGAAGLKRKRRHGGGRPRVYSEAFRMECLQLLSEGKTLGQIEILKGVTSITVSKWAQQAQAEATD